MFNTLTWKRLMYTLWAPFYNGVARFLAPMRRRSIAMAAPQPGERVLLVGAGTGLDLDFLPPGCHISAIDLTPAMLTKLRRRAEKLGRTVDARVMDAQAMEFADGSFDLALLHFIVAVIPDPIRCVRETARVLRPGGRAVIVDKFLPDNRQPPLLMRLLNPITSCLATEITRQVGPIVQASGLTVIRDESSGPAGLIRTVLLHKP